jgi:CubicO group peptidase (beta-lactamase class C family)
MLIKNLLIQIVKKHIIIFLFIISSAILLNQEENNFFAHATAKGVFVMAGSDRANTTPALYLPKDVGMSSETLKRIDSIVKDAIDAKAFPGCQVLVMKQGKTVYEKSFGNYTYESSQEVQPSTIYDLASLSKTTGTLLAVMKLYDDRKIKLTDKASKYLPFLRGTNKENIKIEELLFHESGLPGSLSFHRLAIVNNSSFSNKPEIIDTTRIVKMGNNGTKYKAELVSKVPSFDFLTQVSDSFYLHNRFHNDAMQMIADTRLNGKTYLYSCLNFILLKEIVENISGMSMDIFLDREFFVPMNLNNMSYLPLRKHKKEDIAPTLKKDFLRNGEIQGFVHDPAAAFMGGVSGNAGLFASAREVAKVYQMLLNMGELDGNRYLSEETCQLFTTATSASGRRGLGFDKPVPSNPKLNPCCDIAPQAVFGHTGYTGTCTWADPVNELIYVFLSNRTYPNDGVNKLARMGVRTKIQEVIYQSIK